MPKQVKARAAQDPQEERQVRKLAGSHHAPTDWKFHAQMVCSSWAGKTPNEIATELGCHPQTVRIHLARFNVEGVAGLGMRPASGRKARLTEQKRSRILALVKQAPPGHLETQADGRMMARDEEGSAQWKLNAASPGRQRSRDRCQTQPDPPHLCGGPFVAGILCAKRSSDAPAICPNCSLLVCPIFVETQSESLHMPSATPEELAAAILDSIRAGAHVLNLSVALVHPSSTGERQLEEALDYAARRGVIAVAAAGNQGTVGSSAITRHPWVIPVVAYDLRGRPIQQASQ